MEVLLKDADNTVSVVGLKNDRTGEYVNDATVKVTGVYDKAGALVAGGSFPLTLDYVAASDGDYAGVLPQSLELRANAVCEVVLEIDAGPGLRRKPRVPARVLVDDGTR